MLEKIGPRLLASDAPALEIVGTLEKHTYRQLGRGVARVLRILERQRVLIGKPNLCVGLFMPNSPEWVCADLALLISGHRAIPIPTEFSPLQAFGLLGEADLCLTIPSGSREPHLACFPPDRHVALRKDDLFGPGDFATDEDLAPCLARAAPDLVKSIHTSGTTSTPKGVLLSFGAISAKVNTLADLIPQASRRRYLSLVPLSLLLEQICGIYLILSAGGTLALLPPEEKPLTGGGLPAGHFLPFLAEAKPTFTVMPPSLVEAMKDFASERPGMSRQDLSRALFGNPTPPLVACGGAPVAKSTLTSLVSRGITIYEGYGLSENASVVSWNLPGRNRFGTVGRPLPDCEVRLAEDKELLIRSPTLFHGYQGTDPGSCVLRPDGFLETGDLAEIDKEGFIRICGRKKHLFINTSGRKISAEWIEGILAARPEIRAAVVFGDRKSWPVAIVIPRPQCPPEAVIRAVQTANAELPDYARVRNVAMPLMKTGDLWRYFTLTGRPRRIALGEAFSKTIAQLTSSTHPDL